MAEKKTTGPKSNIDFVAEVWKRAFQERAFKAEDGNMYLWLRGLHYFIVSLPESERKINGKVKDKNGKWVKIMRLYENTKKEWKKLIENTTKARLRGLIPNNQVWDNRNDPMIEVNGRSKIRVNYMGYDVDDGSYFSLDNTAPRDFEEYIKSVRIYPTFSTNQFANQMYEVCVATEKKTIEAVVGGMCKKYGVNLMYCQGQASLTRVWQLAMKAKESGRPVVILGLFDLDCAGWDMPESIMKRLQHFYPHPHHKIVRVALTRELAEREELPDAFEPDDKGYPEVQKQRFYEETGGSSCIELDALSNTVIYEELEKYLKEYCRPQLDKIQERRVKKNWNRKIEKTLEQYDFEQHREDYEDVYSRYMYLHSQIDDALAKFQEDYDVLTEEFYDITNKIKEDLRSELGEQ